MATTQTHLPIQDIKDDIVILKDGSLAVVLETTAVNFGLLSENEQLAIISAFAALLNSLSFSIQILIRSKRLDISSYLNLLANAEQKQVNPLLAKMMGIYRQFIEKTVRENQVLDKQFYIIIPVSFLELGLTKNVEGHSKKALTILIPRRDHVIRQLWRTGLKAKQLSTKELISLFYDLYNPPQRKEVSLPLPAQPTQTVPTKVQPTTSQLPSLNQVSVPPPSSQTPVISVQQVAPQKPQPINPQLEEVRSSNLATPFVVEELADDYSNIV